MIAIELTKSQCENLADFIQYNLYSAIRNDVDIDNIEWLIDMVEIYKKVKENDE